MYKLKLYAYKVAGENAEMRYNFMSIDAVQNTSMFLANMFKGKAHCSSCGVVQYDDEVILERALTDEECEFIKRAFPFVSTYDAQPKSWLK